MPTTLTKTKSGSRHQPERTRATILEAAMREFAMEGVAGARTDAIARSAGVNKALLYYYFKDKEALFGAVLDELFSDLTQAISEAIDRGGTPREKFLGYLCTHFDWVAESPLRPRLFQREMMRSGRNGTPHLKHIVEQYLRPIFVKVGRVLAEGIEAGEFRPVDPAQFVPSVIGVVVFYFATPVPSLITGIDPFAPEQVSKRKAAVIDFVSSALFRDLKGPAEAEFGRSARGARTGRPRDAGVTNGASANGSAAVVTGPGPSRNKGVRQ